MIVAVAMGLHGPLPNKEEDSFKGLIFNFFLVYPVLQYLFVFYNFYSFYYILLFNIDF